MGRAATKMLAWVLNNERKAVKKRLGALTAFACRQKRLYFTLRSDALTDGDAMDDQRTEIPEDDDEIRTIEAKPPSHRYARGWYCLGVAADFKIGSPHTLKAFGTKLVVFQGEKRQAERAERLLPTYGRRPVGGVRSKASRSPVHSMTGAGAGDGKCTLIPYARYVPPRARTRYWPTLGAQPATLCLERS